MKTGVAVLYPNEVVSNRVTEYSESHSLALPKYITDYHAHIFDTLPESNLMISTFQAKSLVFLTRLMGAQRVLEIGVFVGFSSLVWAHAVGPTGKVTGLEFSPEYAKKSEDIFAASGVKNVEVVVGDATQTLAKLSPSEPYDIVFLDADKESYPKYLESILAQSQPGSQNRILRKGGLIVADNVLRAALVADDSSENPWLEIQRAKGDHWRPEILKVIRQFNDMMNSNERLEAFLVPLWDGVNLARLVD